MFLVASVIVPTAAMAAGTGSVSLSSASVSTSTGNSFFVDINTQASVAMSGASTSIDFDTTKLQIVSVTIPAAGTGWNATGASHVTPSASAIGTANSTGHLSSIGAFFSDGSSSLPANTNEVLARVTFFASATGSTTISLPTTGTEPAALIDGTSGTGYGSPIATTPTGTAVTITAGSGGGTSTTTNVTGTVDGGYVALTCPTAVTIPLARNVSNVANFECQIGSNVTWTLNAIDTNSDPATHGYMRDTVQVPAVHLHDSLFVHSNPHLDASNNTVYDSDVNLAGSANAQAVAAGQNNVNQPLAFTQFAEPNDAAGSYAAQVLFSIVSSF
jgi:hypothetical protein